MYRILLIVCCALLCAFTLKGQTIKASSMNITDSIPVNIYRFSEEVRESIKNGISKIKAHASLDSVKNQDFYIVLSEDRAETNLTINYCKKCFFSKLIKSSDRKFRFSSEIFIPIIFGLDMEYSEMLIDENGNKTNISIGGYYIRFNRNGKVTKCGFQQ